MIVTTELREQRYSLREQRRSDRRAFSLIEVVISSLIVGVVLVAALNTVGSATSGAFRTGEQGQAQLLADALMAEILGLGYEEPVDEPIFGPELDETADGTRTAYDDVDDYHGWEAKPPVEKDGMVLPYTEGWIRAVNVEFVSQGDLTEVVNSEEDLKQITVTVTNDRVTATALMVVSDAWRPLSYD